jgi:hypothetical protein
MYKHNLRAEYTKYGQGIMVVFDDEADVFYNREGDMLFAYRKSEYKPTLDGGHFADALAGFMNDDDLVEMILEDTGVREINATTIKEYRDQIKAAFDLGPEGH